MVALIVSIFMMMMFYWTLDSQCTSIMRDIGDAEKRVKALDAEYGRENARWNRMKVRERLDETITRIGLVMQTPKPDQVVRMMPNGEPAPGQMAVVRARARAKTGRMALASPAPRPSSRARR